MNRICVLGSINMDLVVNVENMPKVGETILSKSFQKIAGGKGANQAIAASRCKSLVSMIGKIGKDDNGQTLKKLLKDDNINTDLVFEDEINPTGIAIITVDKNSNNSIVVVSGSNMELCEKDLDKAKDKIKNCDILVSQFETPEDITIKAFNIAKENGKVTILNPAPAKKINNDLLKVTDIIIPNEVEAEVLTGIKVNDLESAALAGEKFLNEGVKFAIITLGEKGAAIIGDGKSKLIEAFKVNAIDTTAAGDSFIGALSSKLSYNNLRFNNLIEAVTFGNKVSSIAVQRKGAQPSIPTIEEVDKIYGDIK